MNHFPLFAALRDRPCLVVGGGEVAARKTAALMRAGARVTVISPDLCAGLAQHADAGRIEHIPGNFDPALVANRMLIVAATSDREVNARVAAAISIRFATSAGSK